MPPSSPTDTQARNDASPLLVFPLLPFGLAKRRCWLLPPQPSSPAHKALGSRASVYTYQFGKSDDDVSISSPKSQTRVGMFLALRRLNVDFRRAPNSRWSRVRCSTGTSPFVLSFRLSASFSVSNEACTAHTSSEPFSPLAERARVLIRKLLKEIVGSKLKKQTGD